MKRIQQQQQQQPKVELSVTSLVTGIRDAYKNLLCFRGWTNREAEATIAAFDNNSEAFAPSTTESWIPKEDEAGKELIAKMKDCELSFGHISRTAYEMHTDDRIVVIETRHEVQRRNTAQDMQRRIQAHAAECEEEKEVLGKKLNEREARLRKKYALMVAKIHNDIAQIEKPIIWEEKKEEEVKEEKKVEEEVKEEEIKKEEEEKKKEEEEKKKEVEEEKESNEN